MLLQGSNVLMHTVLAALYVIGIYMVRRVAHDLVEVLGDRPVVSISQGLAHFFLDQLASIALHVFDVLHRFHDVGNFLWRHGSATLVFTLLFYFFRLVVFSFIALALIRIVT